MLVRCLKLIQLEPKLVSPYTFPSLVPLALLTHAHRAVQPQEIARAKDIVLDLLGWGVTPEYLVDAGVSSAALYAIFKDLNLRLPSNLDMPAANEVASVTPPITEKGALEQKSAVLPPKLARP